MESPFTFATQVVHTASQWTLEWTWPQMPHEAAQGVQAWLDSLRGQIGTFLYRPRHAAGAQPTGITLMQTGFAYNNTVQVQGFAANTETGLRLGQYIQIGEQLLRITATAAASNAQGRVTIEFEPQLRVNIGAGSGVEFANPRGTFRLASSESPGFTLDPDRLPTFGIVQAREVVA